MAQPLRPSISNHSFPNYLLPILDENHYHCAIYRYQGKMILITHLCKPQISLRPDTPIHFLCAPPLNEMRVCYIELLSQKEVDLVRGQEKRLAVCQCDLTTRCQDPSEPFGHKYSYKHGPDGLSAETV